MARVELQQVSKSYSDENGATSFAIRDFSLSAEEGEFLVVLGPSGAGKSTLLRLIAGLEEPATGTISIGERPMNGVPPAERDVAMVFQSGALYPHLTVRENLGFGLMLRRRPRPEIDRQVREAADLLGIMSCLDRLPGALSGGERQRVALGRALVRRPKVFLLDEPFSNLDLRLREQLRAELLRLHQRLGTTMICVTHDQGEAMSLGDRIAVMREGTVQQVGAPLTIYRAPANLFVAGFIGAPRMNLLPGSLVVRDNEVWFESSPTVAPGNGLRWPLPKPTAERLASRIGRKLVLGIRPESLNCGRCDPGQNPHASVETVETPGPEKVLSLQTPAGILFARVHPETTWKSRDSLLLSLDLASAHWFDPDTGTAIN